MKLIRKFMVTITLLCCASSAWALIFKLGPVGDDLVGEVSTVVVQEGDDFNKIGNRFDVGYIELVDANPDVDPMKPEPGTVLIIPTRYILPNAPREGIVINVAEMRLYYFPQNGGEVWTFPVGIGRQGSQTPLGYMKIYEHMDHPAWHSPESIRVERAKEGVLIPKVVPPGPKNPLGPYALRLSRPTYLIHGSNIDTTGVGRRSSAGCIRMFNEDIEKLYRAVKDGESVLVINEPYKLGRHKGAVYVESRLPLHEVRDTFKDLDKVIDRYLLELGGSRVQESIDLKKALRVAAEQQGMPQKIGELK